MQTDSGGMLSIERLRRSRTLSRVATAPSLTYSSSRCLFHPLPRTRAMTKKSACFMIEMGVTVPSLRQRQHCQTERIRMALQQEPQLHNTCYQWETMRQLRHRIWLCRKGSCLRLTACLKILLRRYIDIFPPWKQTYAGTLCVALFQPRLYSRIIARLLGLFAYKLNTVYP